MNSSDRKNENFMGLEGLIGRNQVIDEKMINRKSLLRFKTRTLGQLIMV